MNRNFILGIIAAVVALMLIIQGALLFTQLPGQAILMFVAAICLAPVILANAGVLKGRRATVAGTEAKTIESRGAKYMGPGVTVDGNIVTGNAPKSSRLFGQKINELLKASG